MTSAQAEARDRIIARDNIDIGRLTRDLRTRVAGEIRFGNGDLALYSTDASNYRQIPLGVVVPFGVEGIAEAVKVCAAHFAPVLHRGGGTSLAGQCTNTAVVIDSSKYCNAVLRIDANRRLAQVEPGVVLDDLRTAASRHGLTFGPDPSTHTHCTLGGMIGNNSCGVHSQMSGRTSDNIREMEVLTYDGHRMRVGPTSEEELEQIVGAGGRRGEIYERMRELRDRYAEHIRERYPQIPRRVSGYNLDELLPEKGFNVARALVGSEGTLATVLEATVELVHSPPKRSLLVIGYEDIYRAGDDVARMCTFDPVALEGMDHELVQYMKKKKLYVEYLSLLPQGNGFLFVEFGGQTQKEADEKAKVVAEAIEADSTRGIHGFRVVPPEEQDHAWEVREAGLGATAHVSGETWPGWEDSAVPPDRLGDYMRELRDLYGKYGYEGALYGHFGQGCVHTRINFDLRSTPGLENYRQFMDEASDLCIAYGGSLTAEHGDGQARAELLPKMYGRELIEAFREFKLIWDPDWRMNPGKVVDPYRIDDNMRFGADYDPPHLETHFAFPDDNHSFHYAAGRCVGVGKCRRLDLGKDDVMCPSFVATKEEMHSTRGRARLLFEMLNGDETPQAWHNDAVHEALDLCLSCKGCKNDCPVNVDMATYKAEFLAHYYARRLRPRHAYAFGLIYWWARIASRFPRLANFFTQTPGLSDIAKLVADVAPERKIPAFADETFRTWFQHRGTGSNADGPRVLLWPDTFNNFFKPDTARAAVAVLESAGFNVVLPQQMLCCGRPLYDYGMLNLAKHLWVKTMDALEDDIRAGTPIVGLEPSCVAAFRDELINLFPEDQDARRLKQQTYTLAEFMTKHEDRFDIPTVEAPAVVHGHCHHKSIMGFRDDEKILDKMKLKYEVVPAGCCGMAGAFGFESDHYDVSVKSGEFALLPRVREAPSEALVVADGFSCREQIEQTTNRRALHLAEVLHIGMRGRPARQFPERSYLQEMRSAGQLTPRRVAGTVLITLGAFAAATAVGFLARRLSN